MYYAKYDAIVRLLSSSGVHHNIHVHAPSFTVADAGLRLPFPVERLLKTIAFKIKEYDFVLAAVRGPDRVDYRKLAIACGAKRENIAQLSPEEVEGAFGVEVGCVSPICLREGVNVFFDSQVPKTETIYCGIGRADRTLEIYLRDLLQITQGQVLPLIKETA